MCSATTARAVIGAAAISLLMGACAVNADTSNEQAARDASWEAMKNATYERLGKEEGMKSLAKQLGMTVEEFKEFEASGLSLVDFYAKKSK